MIPVVDPQATRMQTGPGTRPTVLGPFPGFVQNNPRVKLDKERMPLDMSILPPPLQNLLSK